MRILLLILLLALAFVFAGAAGAQDLGCFHPVEIGINGEDAALIRATHAGWMRLTLRWRRIEPERGAFDFSHYDPLLAAAQARGVQVLAVLSTAPVWAGSNANGTRPPADLGLWAAFVRQVATRYRGRVAAYEIWNEPNFRDLGLGVGWDQDHERFPRYVDYLRAAAEAIRAAAPGTRVVAPSTSSLPDERTAQVFGQLETSFEDGRPATAFFDAVSFHANALDNERAAEVESRLAEQLALLASRAPSARGKPLWITELGWKTNRVGEGSQRDRIQTLLTDWSGRCDPREPSHAFLFQLLDVAGEESRGLFRVDRTPKRIVPTFLAPLPYPARTRNPLELDFHAACGAGTCFFEASEWEDNPFAEPYCFWDFDDGSPGETCAIRHIFRQPGRRQVRLRVTILGDTVFEQEQTIEPEATCFDPEPPEAEIFSPLSGTDVRGDVPLDVTVQDNLGLVRVDLLASGQVVDSADTRPVRLVFHSDRLRTGRHVLRLRALDRCGNQTLSAPVEVFTDRRPPAVALLSPADGATLRGRVSVQAQASDNRRVERVELWIDRRLWATKFEPPFNFFWSTRFVAQRPQRLQLRAYDDAGNLTVTPAITVRLDNPP